MPSVYTILFAIIVLAAAFTWILPAGKYNYVVEGTQQVILAKDVSAYTGGERLLPVPNSFTELESTPQGIGDVLTAPIKGFHKAVDISLFILIIGGFLAITMSTGALDAGVAAIVKAFTGKEQLMIPVLITLFALGGSTFGLAEETVAFWAVILPVMNAAGYDRMVSAGVILLGSGVGVLASTVNPFATGIASGFANLSIGDGIGLRLFQLVLLIALTSIFIMRYAAKVKADKSQSVLADIDFDDEFSHVSNEQTEFTGKQKLTMSIFAGTFLLMIYGVIPWSDLGITAVPTLSWWFDELSTLFFAAALLIGLVNRISEKAFVQTFLAGAKDLLSVALVVAVARGIFVIMDNGMIIDTILNWAEGMVNGLSSGAFVLVSYFVHLVLGFFISSTSGLATVSMPLMAPLADFSNVGRDVVITAYQSASGIINLFAPTSAHLVAGLALAKIPYDRFLKWMMPFLAMVFVLTAVLLYAAAMLGA